MIAYFNIKRYQNILTNESKEIKKAIQILLGSNSNIIIGKK